MQVHLLVFERPPKTLDEDIVVRRFLLVVPDDPKFSPKSRLLDLFGEKRGFTISGFKVKPNNGNSCLQLRSNHPTDVATVREKNDPKRYKPELPK